MDNFEPCSDRTKRRKVQAKVREYLRNIHSEISDCGESSSVVAEPQGCQGSNNDYGLTEDNDLVQEIETRSEDLDHIDIQSHSDLGEIPCSSDPDDELYYLPSDSEESSGSIEIEECNPVDENAGNLTNIRQNLAEWTTDFNISHSALSSLLDILISAKLDLPKDPRTLLSTPVSTKLQCLAGGSYYHFGIEHAVHILLSNCSHDTIADINTLTFRINIDGLPLFKSSLQAVWPILGMLKEIPSAGVVVIGIFGGNSKPSSVNEYLEKFLSDLKNVCRSGVKFNSKHFNIALPDAFICDAPARAFLKCIKGHSGYYGCERCVQKGVYVANRMTFPELSASPRKNIEFDEITDNPHHTGCSPLRELGIGCVTDFVLDYMHLVCLGVVKRLIFLWTAGPLKSRISAATLKIISDSLLAVRKCLPREFSRKPRSLQEYRMWKATEFRQFLLYTGPVVLRNKLPKDLYCNFMLLSFAMRMLLSPNSACENQAYIKDLLKVFVQNFSILYGREMVVYNVHSFIHLVDDAVKYGSLDNVSCFPFESFLGRLKRMVRKGQHALPQIIRRLSEVQNKQGKRQQYKTCIKKTVLQKAHFSGPLPHNYTSCQQYEQYLDPTKYLMSCREGDNCFEVSGKVVLIRNILQCESSEILILYEEYKNCQSAFDYPADSTLIGIKSVSNLSGQLHIASPQNFTSKFVVLSLQEKSVVLPVLHTL